MPRRCGWLKNRKKFDGLLTELADSLAVDYDKFERGANAAADRLFKTLQAESEYGLDRFVIGGGTGKNTSIDGHTDYDCVVFINGKEPPFVDVIGEFERIIVDHFKADVKTTPYSLQFQLDGVDFDLLPATNRVTTHNTSGTGREQVRNTLQKMKGIPDDQLRYHNAGLTEGAVSFIKSQSTFVHCFIRLCKKWNLGVDASLSGRSTMVETVAVDVARRVEGRKKRSRSLRSALGIFLQEMRRGDLHVTFDHNYSMSDIPESILQENPLVLDVTNPRNNLLSKGLPEPFSTRAKESQKVINGLNIAAYSRDLVLSDIEEIF